MTRLPMESWNVQARPDLPPYELNQIDARPGSTLPATENHHLWRRSFGKDYRDSWWVELENGTLVPNRVGLSRESHDLIERGGHRIIVVQSKGDTLFYWLPRRILQRIEERGENPYEVAANYGYPLHPQPGPAEREEPHPEHPREKSCPKCKGKGMVVVEEPPAEAEPLPARPKTTWSVRVPKDERENGHEILENLMEAAIEKAAEHGLIRDQNKGANYYTLVAALHKFITD